MLTGLITEELSVVADFQVKLSRSRAKVASQNLDPKCANICLHTDKLVDMIVKTAGWAACRDSHRHLRLRFDVCNQSHTQTGGKKTTKRCRLLNRLPSLVTSVSYYSNCLWWHLHMHACLCTIWGEKMMATPTSPAGPNPMEIPFLAVFIEMGWVQMRQKWQQMEISILFQRNSHILRLLNLIEYV